MELAEKDFGKAIINVLLNLKKKNKNIILNRREMKTWTNNETTIEK